MTKLSNFDQALITCSISQQQYKLVLTALTVLEKLSDAIKHPEVTNTLNACIKHAQKDLGFKFSEKDLNTLQHDVADLQMTMLNSYTDKRGEYFDLANQELSNYVRENFHPDIFNLQDGELLRIEEV